MSQDNHGHSHKWQVMLGLGLVALSAILYFWHYLLFKDSHHIFIYLVGDIAFVPIEVLLVTLIIHRLIERSERKARIEKLNMVVEVFFSELGTELLRAFVSMTPASDPIRKDLSDVREWGPKEYSAISARLKGHVFEASLDRAGLEKIAPLLASKRGFLISLWENPYMLEHGPATDTLRAVLHLAEECARRDALSGLPETDMKHLEGDMRRAFGLMARQWVEYMAHLKTSYPYLYSLASRTNPFNPEATPVVRG